MKPRLPHKGAGGSVPGSGAPPPAPIPADSPACREDRACCCPAHPVVRVIMPPVTGRPHSVDLLLCGHHYRVSREALDAVGAVVRPLPGRVGAAEAALLAGDRQHAEVTGR